MDADTAVTNVVLVTVDSLRADAVGPYDAERHTPVIDELADRGTVFERAFATGNWTPFSFPSILASRPVFVDDGRIGVEESPTLASVLSDAGVATGGFNAANGFLTSHWGYDEGFDEFEPFVAGAGSGVYSKYLAKHPTVEAWLQLAAAPVRRVGSWLSGDGDDRPFLDASRMFDVEHAATSFLEGASSPFFLWVHYMDAHTPYVPAPRYIREVSSDLIGTHRMLLAHTRTGLGWEVGDRTLADLRTLYQAAIRQIDASIGRLLETLSACGLDDSTAVVLAGDHGEEFQEHGHLAHYPKLYDELIRVPLVVDVPGADSRRVERQVALDAIPPTVADLLGVDAPAAWRGDSLAPAVVDGTPLADDLVVSVTVRGEEVTTQPIPRSLADGDLLVSVRDRDWTYVANCEEGTADLYHRPSDPAQQIDLSPGSNADVTTTGDDPPSEDAPTAGDAPTIDDRRRAVDRLAPLAATHADALRARNDSRAAEEVDDDLEARLAALGYR